jgi:hypothetical protein
MSTRDIDVFLRGQRNYIQGTQIISRTAELLDDGEWVFQQAEFRKISTSQLQAKETVAQPTPEAIATIRFTNNDSGEIKTFEVSENPAMAPHSDDSMGIAVARGNSPIAPEESQSSCWTYQNVICFEDCLNVIVQSIKAEHQVLWPNSTDIWLTGFRNLGLSVKGNYAGEGRIELSLWRQLQGKVGNQTFWQIRLPEAGLTGMANFAYRNRDTIHAN